MTSEVVGEEAGASSPDEDNCMQQQERVTYSLIPLFILQHKRFVVAAPFKAWLLKLLPYRQRNAYASAFFFPFKHMLEVGARKKRHMNATFIHGNKNDKSIFFFPSEND